MPRLELRGRIVMQLVKKRKNQSNRKWKIDLIRKTTIQHVAARNSNDLSFRITNKYVPMQIHSVAK